MGLIKKEKDKSQWICKNWLACSNRSTHWIGLRGSLMEEYRTQEKISTSSLTWEYSSRLWDLVPWQEPLGVGKPVATLRNLEKKLAHTDQSGNA